jgi:hypothetical protein
MGRFFGGREALGLIGGKLGLKSGFWAVVSGLNGSLANIAPNDVMNPPQDANPDRMDFRNGRVGLGANAAVMPLTIACTAGTCRSS